MPVTINGTTGVIGPDGSASTPSYQGTDSNTGMFFPAADTIAFAEGGTEVARFDSSGNLGIGTSSPSVAQNTVGSATYSGVANGTALFQATKTNTAADAGVLLGSITGNTPFIAATNLNGGAGSATPLAFYTAANERARIDTSGNLLVGTTSAQSIGGRLTVVRNGDNAGTFITDNNNFPLVAWQRTGSANLIFFGYGAGGTQVGTITTNGTGTFYNTTSDYRLKEQVQPMTGALAKVAALKPCTYNWKADGSAGEGFIAHELAEVVPQCVTGEKDAVDVEGKPVYQGIDTSFLVATLTAAIQELKAEVDALKAQLGAQA